MLLRNIIDVHIKKGIILKKIHTIVFVTVPTTAYRNKVHSVEYNSSLSYFSSQTI